MTSDLAPYLNFRGRTREAMEFYRGVFGGELTSSTFADFSMPGIGEDEKDSIMHSQLITSAGYTIMAADVPSHMEWRQGENTFSVSLFGDAESADELRGYFDRLSDGGQVGQPLEKAPWGDSFGMLTDRFGVSWLVNITGA